jgi:hypothetical protein
MQAPQSLRRPTNWQDFESLCKKLWGEIWQCPEIKKNGRAGQSQHGVDIYGIPNGEIQYYGIQCKGKDEYSNKQFTEDEIINEIEKAKAFTPSLKKFYLATTAVKDATIETFVRIKNIESINAGYFIIDIFSWEDIVELIDENKQIHDYYVKSQNYKANKNATVTFEDGADKIILRPLFKKQYRDYKMKIIPNPFYDPFLGFSFDQQAGRTPGVIIHRLDTVTASTVNQSFCPFRLKINNVGLEPIEEFKIIYEVKGNVQALAKDNFKSKGIFDATNQYVSDVRIHSNSVSGEIVCKKAILVSDDGYVSDKIFIKPNPVAGDCIIHWKLISKYYKNQGELCIDLQPDVKAEYQSFLIEDPLKVRNEESEIEDFITSKK